MDREPDVEPAIYLRWATEKPNNRGPRTSFDFVFNHRRWCLEMDFHKPFCEVKLCPRQLQQIRLDCSLVCECLLKVGGNAFFEITNLEYSNAGGCILCKSLTREQALPSVEWTVLCSFKARDILPPKSISLQVGYKRVKISKMKTIVTPKSVDRGVQASPEVPRDLEALSSDISGLLEGGIQPDFEIKCGGRTFPTHRSVLAARSEVWRAMLCNQMQESRTRSCDIKDVEVLVLESLLKFVYSGKLEDHLAEDTVCKLYEAADKYAVRSLIAACSYWLMRHLTEDNCVRYLVTADSHSDQELKAAAVSFILKNPEVFQSETWSTFLKEHLKLASEVLQTYVTSLHNLVH